MLKLIAVASIALMVVACGGSKSGADTTPLVVAASTATPRPCGDEAAIETVRPSVVRVSTEDGSIGTGIIVAENRVLTNAHVVEGSTTVRVESQSGAVEGSVIGTDSVIDVALIQAPTRDLPVVAWAEPSELRAGQRLLALGYALDLPGEPSSTGGIFSALRTLEGIDYLQTDTPINPGNSGGPLFTQCGEIVGLNTFTLVDSELNLQGLGFAIRSSVLKSAISDLGSEAYAERPQASMTSQDATLAVPVVEGPPSAIPPSQPALPTTAPVEQPSDILPAAVCGAGASMSLVGPSPIGRTLHSGDDLSVTLAYSAPGCTVVGALFIGVSAVGSPWREYVCSQLPCKDGPLGSFLGEEGPPYTRLATPTGMLTLRADEGSLPFSLNSYPTLEGFTLCQIHVTLHDDAYGGPYFDFYLGAEC